MSTNSLYSSSYTSGAMNSGVPGEAKENKHKGEKKRQLISDARNSKNQVRIVETNILKCTKSFRQQELSDTYQHNEQHMFFAESQQGQGHQS